MLRHILSTSVSQIGCHCRHYARNRFSRPSTAADPSKFVENIRAINKVPTARKPRSTDFPDDPDDLSQHEGDFINLDSTHKAHRQELAEERERIRHRTVQAKYFRTDNLNFLTWAEKEQIRHLHDRDPEEWCVEHLAESFPADCETIAKIVRARWTPRNAAKIQKHDEAVRRAWLDLQRDQVGDIDPGLKEHLLKFSGRTVKGRSTDANVVSKELSKIEIKDDFSKILTSCKKYQQPTVAREEEPSNELKLPPPTDRDTFVLGKSSHAKPLMFRELDIPENATELRAPSATTHNPFVDPRGASDEDELSMPSKITPLDTNVIPKYAMSDVQTTEDDIRKLSMPAIRDHITIPRHLWQRGATYKLNDCFYDDDGEFLYRVPGMTGHK